MKRARFVRIPLHGARGKNSFALVDIVDLPRVAPYRWFLTVTPNGVHYAMRTGVVNNKRSGRRTTLYMHTMIRPLWPRIDHHNGDGLDNRRHNLRRSTEAQNQMNRKKFKSNTSGYKGVCHLRARRKWRAMIRHSVVTYLGDFPTAEAAARAYDAAARKYHKKFARLNFPRRGEQRA